MSEVHFHPRVEPETVATARYYNRQRPGLGGDFTAAVERTVALIVAMPLIGTPIRGTIRRQQVQRFPFTIIYRVEGEHIYIAAVMHERRRPDYWIRRVPQE